MKSIDILNKIATFAFRERFKILTLKINIMNKAQLIDAIAEKAGLTKADSKKALEAFVETVGEALKGGDKVALIGFGSFSVSERSARSGRPLLLYGIVYGKTENRELEGTPFGVYRQRTLVYSPPG